MDIPAALQKNWKPAAIVLGGVAVLYLGAKLLGGSSGGAAVPTAATTDPSSTLAAQLATIGAGNAQAQATLGAQTTVQLAQLDAQTYASTIAAHAQVGSTALAAASQLQLGSIQALTTGFSNFTVATAQEAAAAASSAAKLGVANDQSTSQNLNAFGNILGGAAQLVGSFYGGGLVSGMSRFNGLGSSGFNSVQSGQTGLPIIVVGGNSGLVRNSP